MGIVTAGMHKARIARGKSFFIREVVGVGAFLNRHAVNIKAAGKRRTGASRIQNGDAPS